MSKTYIILILLVYTIKTQSQEVRNYFSTDPAVKFQKENFILKWSNTTGSQWTQEYLRKPESVDKFNKMILIDILLSEKPVKEIVNAKIAELKERKEKDPVSNYRILQNESSNEFLLDFLVSDGTDNLYEWNVYKYKAVPTKKGTAVLVFAYVMRSFKDSEIGLDHFFPFLKSEREKIIQQVLAFDTSKINLAN